MNNSFWNKFGQSAHTSIGDFHARGLQTTLILLQWKRHQGAAALHYQTMARTLEVS